MPLLRKRPAYSLNQIAHCVMHLIWWRGQQSGPVLAHRDRSAWFLHMTYSNPLVAHLWGLGQVQDIDSVLQDADLLRSLVYVQPLERLLIRTHHVHNAAAARVIDSAARHDRSNKRCIFAALWIQPRRTSSRAMASEWAERLRVDAWLCQGLYQSLAVYQCSPVRPLKSVMMPFHHLLSCMTWHNAVSQSDGAKPSTSHF